MRQASLSGTLFLPTHNLQLPLRRSYYELTQRRDHRGRPTSKVRFGSLLIEVDASQAQLNDLTALAVSSHTTVDGYAAFERADGQGTFVSVWFEKACLHSFTEHFDATGGRGREPSWVVQFALSPELMGRESGLAGSFIAPAPGEHGLPQAIGENFLRKAANKFFPGLAANKTPSFVPPLPYDPNDLATHFKRPAVSKPISPEVAAMFGTTFKIASTAKPEGPDGFEEAVKADLQAIYDTPTGKGLIDSIRSSGKAIFINYHHENQVALSITAKKYAYYQKDGITPGDGVALPINYNPFSNGVGNKMWNNRPPAIGLAHELIHIEQAAYGRMKQGATQNPVGVDLENSDHGFEVDIFELETVGVDPYNNYAYTENKIRKEWNPPQCNRSFY